MLGGDLPHDLLSPLLPFSSHVPQRYQLSILNLRIRVFSGEPVVPYHFPRSHSRQILLPIRFWHLFNRKRIIGLVAPPGESRLPVHDYIDTPRLQTHSNLVDIPEIQVLLVSLVLKGMHEIRVSSTDASRSQHLLLLLVLPD
jgi:hypothetical protein